MRLRVTMEFASASFRTGDCMQSMHVPFDVWAQHPCTHARLHNISDGAWAQNVTCPPLLDTGAKGCNRVPQVDEHASPVSQGMSPLEESNARKCGIFCSAGDEGDVVAKIMMMMMMMMIMVMMWHKSAETYRKTFF